MPSKNEYSERGWYAARLPWKFYGKKKESAKQGWFHDSCGLLLVCVARFLVNARQGKVKNEGVSEGNGKVRARLENASEVLGLLEQVRLGLHPSQAMLLNAALWYGRLGSGNGQFDTTHSKGRGPPTLRLHGQTCHQIGTLLPVQGLPPQYAKLYIFDTEHEVNNIMDCFRENKFVERDVVTKLKSMLDDCNLHAKVFRMARDMLYVEGQHILRLKAQAYF
ncbi:hypothetical protein KIW84_045632 [Lathyrus oleraceus]|uniref:Uncharacterized protein n=1 Tax=Pisum sativum TaxID=3888 RepID=A0A9D4XKN8_PEA|nr:hypothetical protein KIW84_045632 [Pisum sativum]